MVANLRLPAGCASINLLHGSSPVPYMHCVRLSFNLFKIDQKQVAGLSLLSWRYLCQPRQIPSGHSGIPVAAPAM